MVGYNELKDQPSGTPHYPGQPLQQEHWVHRVEEYAQTVGDLSHHG